ncbi:TPA: PilN family type IVB pilus formation outer membrane protein, partial [Enterobacter hormaechei subsp. hoffmannii]|nr:PilN family type IVB pilus formation outer membrane protein [Enterobacter hormaechei subsp. hoffmannii]
MKKTLLRRLLMASCFAMLAGCTFSEINKMQTKAQSDATVARAQAQLPRTQHQQPLTWTERQWINPSPIPVAVRERNHQAPSCNITQAKNTITLQELAQRITALCGTPVIFTPDALDISQSSVSTGVTRQMSGTLPPPDDSGRTPLASLGGVTSLPTGGTSQPLNLTGLMWQGDLGGLLDLMASRSGLYWRMDNGTIVFYLMETRTY